jgi:hypothetical protein
MLMPPDAVMEPASQVAIAAKASSQPARYEYGLNRWLREK